MSSVSLVEDEIYLLSKLSLNQRREILPKLEYLLDQIDLEKLDYFDRIILLLQLLESCKKYDEDLSLNDVVKTILFKWCNNDLDIDGIIGDLAANSDCSDAMLKYLVFLFPHSNPITILDTHIRTRYGHGMIFSYTAERVLKAYNIENLEERDWHILIEASEDSRKDFDFNQVQDTLRYMDLQNNPITQDNKDVMDYINSKLKHKKEVYKKPNWVSLKDYETDEYYQKLSVGETQENSYEELDNLKNMIKRLTSKQIIESNDLGDEAPLKTEEVIETFVSIKDNFKDENSNSMIRYYGPCNSILGFDCIGSFKIPGECKGGPCRMFYCMCREFDEEDALNEEDVDVAFDEWFSGECDICKVKIKKMRYAVRFPVDGGGWLGCYCSFTCMRKTKVRPIYSSDEFRIGEIETIIKHIGICDI